MDPQKRSELLKKMRFQFLFEKQYIVTRLSDPERKRVPNLEVEVWRKTKNPCPSPQKIYGFQCGLVGSGAKPQPLTILVHFCVKKWSF